MAQTQRGKTETTQGPAVLVTREDRIAVITLNRPEDGNRWRKETLLAFEPIVEALHQDEETHVVVIRGAGEEYFSWGAFDPAIRGVMGKQEIVDFVLREARQPSDELRAKLEWSHDVDEAIAAHREGRKPRFTGK